MTSGEIAQAPAAPVPPGDPGNPADPAPAHLPSTRAPRHLDDSIVDVFAEIEAERKADLERPIDLGSADDLEASA